MNRRIVFFVLPFILFAATAEPHLVIKNRAEEASPLLSPEETRGERLRRGEVLTEGGYEGKAIWGKMEGVIEASPETVWKIFIENDRWKNYDFPSLMDARVVNEQITQEVNGEKSVHSFYKAWGSQSVDVNQIRERGARWHQYSFQYYDVPWPVANRWMILKVDQDETQGARGSYRSDWTREAGNVRTVEGYLIVEPFEGDRRRTRLEYRAISDPGAHIPRFLVRWGVERMMPAIIRAVRRAASSLDNRGQPSSESRPRLKW